VTVRTQQQVRESALIACAHALVAASLHRRMHERSSRFVAEALAEFVTTLRHAEAVGVEMPLRLQFDEHRMHHDGIALDGPSLQARSLLRDCCSRGIAVLAIAPRIGADEVNRLLDLLLLPENVGAFDRELRDATLQAFGLRHVRVTLRSIADPCDRKCTLAQDDVALAHYQDLAEELQRSHALAHHDRELDVGRTTHVLEQTILGIDDRADEPSLLLSLSMQDDVDRFTVGHSVRVALLALQVARGLGATRSQLVRVGSAALLHDIGKSKIPQEILWKQGALTPDEWQVMAQHPRLGAQILLEQNTDVDPCTLGAAFCHHMGNNGRGYPKPSLPILPSGISRLVRVCDVFEALTAVRPYKKALTPIEAYAVMFRNVDGFDPVWLRRFARTLGLFPVGTRVELDDGARAIVTEQSEHFDRPVVRLLTGPAGGDLPAGHPGRLRIGDAFEGRTPRIRTVETHDRHLTVPDFDDVATPTVHDACLSPDCPGSH
jgi:putative nucleotidyltransferase with HDIG domain